MKAENAPNEQGQRTVLVTDSGRGSSIAIIRALGRKGYRVIAADSDARSLGFRSRYVQDRVVYPVPQECPEKFIQILYDAVRDKKIDLIIPVTDEIIHPLAHTRARFEKLCQLALPDPDGLELVTDKAKT